MSPIVVVAVFVESAVAMSVVLIVVPVAVGEILPSGFQKIPSEGTRHP